MAGRPDELNLYFSDYFKVDADVLEQYGPSTSPFVLLFEPLHVWHFLLDGSQINPVEWEQPAVDDNAEILVSRFGEQAGLLQRLKRLPIELLDFPNVEVRLQGRVASQSQCQRRFRFWLRRPVPYEGLWYKLNEAAAAFASFAPRPLR